MLNDHKEWNFSFWLIVREQDPGLDWKACDHYFNKGNISISRRYQVHPVFATTKCPNGITHAHNQKEELHKRKVLLQ
jgi:hypothetical protein